MKSNRRPNNKLNRKKKSLSEAEKIANRGEAKIGQWLLREAARDYEKAANLLPEGYEDIMADYLHTAAYNFEEIGALKKAEKLYERAIILYEQIQFVEKEPDIVLDAMNRLANIYFNQDEFVKAEPLCKKTLEVNEKNYGKESVNIVADINDLALTYMMQDKFTQSRSLYERVLAITEEKYGDNSLQSAETFNRIGITYSVEKKYIQAEPFYEKALAIYKVEYGDENQHVGRILENLAMLHNDWGNYEKAKIFYEKALALLEINDVDDTEFYQDYRNLLKKMNKD